MKTSLLKKKKKNLFVKKETVLSCAANRNILHHSTDLTTPNIMSIAIKNHDFQIYLVTWRAVYIVLQNEKKSYKIK